MKLNPCFDPLGPGVLGLGWRWGIWNTMVVFACWYSWMALMHTATSALVVALGFGEPKEWPSLFGRLRDLTGVRAFWGTVWHQLLRRVLSSHGKYLCKALRLKPGTLLNRYTSILIAFFMSGIFHGMACYKMTSNPSTIIPHIQFFTMQAIAIMVEDGVIFIGKTYLGLRGNSLIRVVGMAWFWVWTAWSGSNFLDTFVRSGAFAMDAPGPSVLQGVLELDVRNWSRKLAEAIEPLST